MLTFSQKKQQTPKGILCAQQSDRNAHKNAGCVGGWAGEIWTNREKDWEKTVEEQRGRFYLDFFFIRKKKRNEIVFFLCMGGWLISAPSDWAITPSTSFLGTRLLSVIADSWEAQREREKKKKQKCSLTVSLPEWFVVAWLKTFPSRSL